MNEKEVAELRRQLHPERNGISKIYGCYVNENRTIVSTFSQSLGLTAEEELESYLGLLKKSLSGVLGKNLLDIEFPNDQVVNGAEHALLMKLRDSKLEDSNALQSFYDKVISSVSFDENYLILLAVNSYDVPRRGKDDQELEDSDEIYNHLICSICPVKKTKPSLGYDYHQQAFCTIAGDWLVSPPQLGFLFPTFDDRTTNIYRALCYTRSTEDAHDEFIQAVFHTEPIQPAAEQKRSFEAVLSNSLEEECSIEVVQAVHEQLSRMIEMHKESKIPEPLTIHRSTVEDVLEECGVSEEHRNHFCEQYDAEFGEDHLVSPRNLIDNKRFEVKTTGVAIHVKPESRDLVQTRVIDGIKYILIRAEDSVEVNGVNIQFDSESDAVLSPQ